MFKDERNAQSVSELCERKYDETRTKYWKIVWPGPFEDVLDAQNEKHIWTLEYLTAQARLRELRRRPLWKKILDNLF